jgi:hypothetical protein
MRGGTAHVYAPASASRIQHGQGPKVRHRQAHTDSGLQQRRLADSISTILPCYGLLVGGPNKLIMYDFEPQSYCQVRYRIRPAVRSCTRTLCRCLYRHMGSRIGDFSKAVDTWDSRLLGVAAVMWLGRSGRTIRPGVDTGCREG